MMFNINDVISFGNTLSLSKILSVEPLVPESTDTKTTLVSVAGSCKN